MPSNWVKLWEMLTCTLTKLLLVSPFMPPSNLAQLTQSHKAIAAKKKFKREQIKEVVFDDEARRDFLTGFHKRKLAKADAARKKAKEREKQERLESRREQRRILREKALENAAEVENAYGAILGNAEDEDSEWEGVGPSSSKQREQDEEYEDEEVIATVTVIEDFDPTTITTGPPLAQQMPTDRVLPISLPKPRSKSGPSSIKKKVREKKIHYETKDGRKHEVSKQRARKFEKAELAGGKASRKSKIGRHEKRKGGSKR